MKTITCISMILIGCTTDYRLTASIEQPQHMDMIDGIGPIQAASGTWGPYDWYAFQDADESYNASTVLSITFPAGTGVYQLANNAAMEFRTLGMPQCTTWTGTIEATYHTSGRHIHVSANCSDSPYSVAAEINRNW